MFIIPLGLPKKLNTFPWATVMLALVTCIYSIWDFEKNHQRARKTHQIIEEAGLLKATQNLVVQYCEKSKKNRTKECVSDFDQKLERNPASLENLPAYTTYTTAKSNFERQRLLNAIETADLMRGNFTIRSSFTALMRHDGWLHLIGNMLIFLAFAIPLEQRIGIPWIFTVYILGGFVSNILQLPFLPKGIALLGASGAVSAIVGAFSAFFWKEKMSVLISFFFVLNRKILMPSWIYICTFFVLSDLTGILSTSSHVAHIAHLSGFAFGVLAAYLYNEFIDSSAQQQGANL